MPCAADNADRKVEYLECFSSITNVIRNKCATNYLMIIGDFNANAKKGFLSF